MTAGEIWRTRDLLTTVRVVSATSYVVDVEDARGKKTTWSAAAFQRTFWVVYWGPDRTIQRALLEGFSVNLEDRGWDR